MLRNSHIHNNPSGMMLARMAYHLFWMGRYLERAEHLARYIKVQYYQVLDAPIELNRLHTLDSILFMAGGKEVFLELENELTDEHVLLYCCYDRSNEFSIFNLSCQIRDNASSARHLLSTELWESINRFYHKLGHFSVNGLMQEGRYDFCQHVIESAYIVKGLLHNTLLQDNILSVVQIGIHLERAMQTVRILLSKLRDIELIDPKDATRNLLENYHWVNLLKSTGGFDISRKIYKKIEDKRNILEFLILHPLFPKSVIHNLYELAELMENFSSLGEAEENSAQFLIGKTASELRYTKIKEVLRNENVFLAELREKLYAIGGQFETQYLKY